MRGYLCCTLPTKVEEHLEVIVLFPTPRQVLPYLGALRGINAKSLLTCVSMDGV